MSHARLRSLLAVLVLSALIFSLLGCASRPQAAQHLFDKGEYQAVIDKYPDLEIARRARAKLAEELLAKGEFQEVIAKYPSTPAAYKAKTDLAQKLFDEGYFHEVLDSFPHSPLAEPAKERLAEMLYNEGKYDSVVMLYPETPRGKELKNKEAADALVAAKKLRGQARLDALQQFMGKYSGTESYKEAAQLYTQAREEQNKKAAAGKK